MKSGKRAYNQRLGIETKGKRSINISKLFATHRLQIITNDNNGLAYIRSITHDRVERTREQQQSQQPHDSRGHRNRLLETNRLLVHDGHRSGHNGQSHRRCASFPRRSAPKTHRKREDQEC